MFIHDPKRPYNSKENVHLLILHKPLLHVVLKVVKACTIVIYNVDKTQPKTLNFVSKIQSFSKCLHKNTFL